ncbi:YHYH domain-containing protein [Acinetobacter pittii]|nr:YHYH domain-containing protein [Acinetobacter pittii]
MLYRHVIYLCECSFWGTNSQGCHTNSKTGDYHCH